MFRFSNCPNRRRSITRSVATRIRPGTFPIPWRLVVVAALLAGSYSAPALAYKKQGMSLFEPDDPLRSTGDPALAGCGALRGSAAAESAAMNHPALSTDTAREARPEIHRKAAKGDPDTLEETMSEIEQQLDAKIDTGIQQQLRAFHTHWSTRGEPLQPLLERAAIANRVVLTSITEVSQVRR